MNKTLLAMVFPLLLNSQEIFPKYYLMNSARDVAYSVKDNKKGINTSIDFPIFSYGTSKGWGTHIGMSIIGGLEIETGLHFFKNTKMPWVFSIGYATKIRRDIPGMIKDKRIYYSMGIRIPRK